MVDDTTMMSDGLVVSEKRPRRPLLSFLTRWYSIIFAIFVSLILLVSAAPYAPLWTGLWIALYWVYQGVKLLLRRHQRHGFPYDSKWVQLARALLLIVFVSVFLIYLYRYTAYLRANGATDMLWLLFVLAAFITSQRGVTELLGIALIFASCCLTATHILAAAQFAALGTGQALGWVIIEKVLWMALLAFVLHVLIRYVGDGYANMQLLHKIEEPTVAIRAMSDEVRLFETAVKCVADDFKYPDVNVFRLEPDGSLKAIAGASGGGRALTQAGFVLPPGVGILGQVVQTGKPHPANNVRKDPHYFSHSAFPKTKAELAVPIKIKERVWGVFDIQAHTTGVFLGQDVRVMEILAGHLGRVLDNIRVHGSRNRISTIVESIAHRILSEPELEGTLNQIVLAAHEELNADIVALYERDPLTNAVTGPICSGGLRHPEAIRRTVLEPTSLVYRLLSADQDDYFHDDVRNLPDDGLFAPSGYHRASGDPTFVAREEIRSRAIIRLRTDMDCVGLMFLNYRTLRSFGDEERQAFHTFAHLAGLAIQKAQSHHRQMQSEREDLARRLHDQLMATADGASRVIAMLLRDGSLAEPHRARLMIGRDALQELQSDIRYLNETLKDTVSSDLPGEVDKIVKRIKDAYGISCEVQWTGYDGRISAAAVNQIKLILNESILNAIKHGQATRVQLGFRLTDGQITVMIEDNGSGFDATRIRPRGLQNIRERAERLGGNMRIETAPGRGTRISALLPVRLACTAQEEEHVDA
jgi:signal transduction histidine kinase